MGDRRSWGLRSGHCTAPDSQQRAALANARAEVTQAVLARRMLSRKLAAKYANGGRTPSPPMPTDVPTREQARRAEEELEDTQDFIERNNLPPPVQMRILHGEERQQFIDSAMARAAQNREERQRQQEEEEFADRERERAWEAAQQAARTETPPEE